MARSNESPVDFSKIQAALAQAEEEIDIAYLALLMASMFQGPIDIDYYLSCLDEWASQARDHTGHASQPAHALGAINETLFERLALAANVEDYYDPRNSFLNEVIDRKLGIPISLSVIYIAVGRRMGLPLEGVALPMHFIVKHVSDVDIYIDPFRRGKILTVSECKEIVEQAYGAHVPFQERFLESVGVRSILYRMLNNLKYVYLRRQEYESAGKAVDMMLMVRPDEAEEVRDRGLIYVSQRQWSEAARYFERYLVMRPDAEDAARIRKNLADAQDKRARRN